MEPAATLGVGERANDGHAGASLKEVVADDQGRSPTALLVPGLRVEGDGDEVPFSGT